MPETVSVEATELRVSATMTGHICHMQYCFVRHPGRHIHRRASLTHHVWEWLVEIAAVLFLHTLIFFEAIHVLDLFLVPLSFFFSISYFVLFFSFPTPFPSLSPRIPRRGSRKRNPGTKEKHELYDSPRAKGGQDINPDMRYLQSTRVLGARMVGSSAGGLETIIRWTIGDMENPVRLMQPTDFLRGTGGKTSIIGL